MVSAGDISWHTVNHMVKIQKIIATVGVVSDKVVIIAYHYDLRDSNLNGKVSLFERAWGSEKSKIDFHIGKILSQKGVIDDSLFAEKILKNLWGEAGAHAITVAKFAYFKILIGPQISFLLTQNGVAGIRWLTYKVGIESAIQGLL